MEGKRLNNGYYNQNMNQMNQKTPGFTKYLILSILQTLCCCQITGIIAFVFTLFANSAFKKGDMMDYQSKLKGARTSLIVGLVIGVIATIFIVVVYGAIGITAISQS